MNEFKKTDKQKEAIKLLSSAKKYVALFGGSRSGKTFILVYALIVRAAKCPNSRHAIVRATYNAVKRSIFQDTLVKVLNICFPNLPVQWNKSESYITLPNGSVIMLFGLDKNNADRILGLEFSTIYFNEASELEYAPVQTVISRLAQKNELKKKVYYDFNPSVKTHWSHWYFIKKLNPIDNEPLINPDSIGSLLINPKDNLENIDEDYIALLNAMPEKERDRFLNGLFSDSNDGAAYYAFDRERHVRDTKLIPGTVFLSMDFNCDPMTATILQLQSGKVIAHDEIFLRNSDTFKMCDALKKKGYSGGVVIPDSTGKNRKTSGKSDFQILKEAGFTIRYCRNGFVTDRVNNVNRCLSNNLVEINPRCKKLINDLEKVVWKNNQLDQKTDHLLTHCSDNYGYGLNQLLPMSGVTKATIKVY